jgi:hypothetical protein
MKTIRTSGRRRFPRVLVGARPATTMMLCTLAGLAPAACNDDTFAPLPTAQMDVAEAGLQAAPSPQHRPFQYSQSWDASGIDFTNPCIVQVPDPTTPGASIQIAFPGVARGSGTASHVGRHTVEIYWSSCTWDAEVGAIAVQGPTSIVAASGDILSGTYEGYWYLSPSGGGDFTGFVLFTSGTGRFANVTGEASLYAHDNSDGSGWDWGSGWIAY